MSAIQPIFASDASRLSASLFRLLEMSTDLIAVFGPDLRHVWVNEGVVRFMSLPRERILGHRYDELPMSAANASHMQAVIADVFATGVARRIEVRGRSRDTLAPTVFDISYHAEHAADGRVELVVGVSRDVSQLRFAEERARASAERLGILLDSVDAAIIGVNQQLEIDFVNRVAARELQSLGVTSALQDSPIARFLPAANALAIQSHVVNVLGSGVPVMFEHEIIGPPARRLAVQVMPERDAGGAVRGAVLILRDRTLERHRETQLRLSERLASLGRIAAGVAHEITNPLSAVYGNLELARSALDRFTQEQGEPAEQLADIDDMLRDAHDGAERIRQIVEEIGLLSRADTTSAGRVDPGELIDKVVRMLAGPIAVKAHLSVRTEPAPEVAGSAPQLVQVLVNLLENALLAMPPGRAVDENRIELELTREPSEVVIRVCDNGVGIAPDVLERAFDPFFTTRTVGAGMGLGLTIAHSIAVSHHGTLRLESTLGKGTRITLRLPIPDE